MEKSIQIVDASDRGINPKRTKTLQYRVGVLHTPDPNEPVDVYAKFRVYGDARRYADQVARGTVWFAAVVIQN